MRQSGPKKSWAFSSQLGLIDFLQSIVDYESTMLWGKSNQLHELVQAVAWACCRLWQQEILFSSCPSLAGTFTRVVFWSKFPRLRNRKFRSNFPKLTLATWIVASVNFWKLTSLKRSRLFGPWFLFHRIFMRQSGPKSLERFHHSLDQLIFQSTLTTSQRCFGENQTNYMNWSKLLLGPVVACDNRKFSFSSCPSLAGTFTRV